MESGLTKRLSHCLGAVTFSEGSALMTAAVLRDVVTGAAAGAVRPSDGECVHVNASGWCNNSESAETAFCKDALRQQDGTADCGRAV